MPLQTAMKATQLYDFSVPANGSFQILADANFYKVLTAAGDLRITRDGGATVRPMRAGRGEREVEFKSLVITDISGAPNSGTILVGDSNFIDDTIVLSSAINVRPEAYNIAGQATLAAGAVQIVAPASNTGGLMVQELQAAGNGSTSGFGTLLAKSSAPANLLDGDLLGCVGYVSIASSNGVFGRVQNIFIPAGKGVYFFGSAGSVYSVGYASLIGRAL